MTLIVAVTLTKVRTCNRPLTVILTKVRIYRFLTITQIPDQVRNDGTAVVILTNPPGGNHPRSCHPDESQDLRSSDIDNDSESSSE